MISSVRNLCIFSLLVGAGTTFGLALDKRANPAVVLDLDGTVVIKGGWREATAGGERWPINTYTEYTKGQHWLIDGLGQNPPVTLQYLEWESMGSQLKSHGACVLQLEGGKDHIDGMAIFKLSNFNLAFDGPLVMIDHSVVLYCALQGQG